MIRRPGTTDDLQAFRRAGKLKVALPEIERRMAAGDQLIYERSQFVDEGDDDWTALYLNGEQVAYWPGF